MKRFRLKEPIIYLDQLVTELDNFISKAKSNKEGVWPGCEDGGCEFYAQQHRHEQQWRDIVILPKENS